jgi:DNA-binding transcriptional MerR regulator
MADEPSNFVSGLELARRLGIDESMVRKYVRNGLFARESRGPNTGKYDAAKCIELYQINRDPDAVLKGIAGSEAVGAPRPAQENALTRARAASAVLSAQKQQIELAKMKGELISKAEARAACRACVTVITERLDGAAAQIGPRVVGLDAVGAELIAREILTAVRREIAGLADAVEAIGHG